MQHVVANYKMNAFPSSKKTKGLMRDEKNTVTKGSHFPKQLFHSLNIYIPVYIWGYLKLGPVMVL